MWSVLNFGKHSGKSLPEILLNDPDWFFWAIDEEVLAKTATKAEARDLNFKARNIKIPRPPKEHWRVQYNVYREGFMGFEFVQVSSAAEAHPNRLDLSVPHRETHYDKLGNKLLLRSFKTYYFGDRKTRLTRKKCWEFFDNAANFYEPVKSETRDEAGPYLPETFDEQET
jgi:hypothetical protein